MTFSLDGITVGGFSYAQERAEPAGPALFDKLEFV